MSALMVLRASGPPFSSRALSVSMHFSFSPLSFRGVNYFWSIFLLTGTTMFLRCGLRCEPTWSERILRLKLRAYFKRSMLSSKTFAFFDCSESLKGQTSFVTIGIIFSPAPWN